MVELFSAVLFIGWLCVGNTLELTILETKLVQSLSRHHKAWPLELELGSVETS